MRDIAGRVVQNPETYFFQGVIFGYCLAHRRFLGFEIAPHLAADGFSMAVREMQLVPNLFYPYGSGKEEFLRLHHELRNQPDPGVIRTLSHMVAQGAHHEVGGHVQIGISGTGGFRLSPVLNLAGAQDRLVTFLGWDVSQAPELDGYRIGFEAIGLD
ncbi:hypothetical protein [Burkholderia paludis]|uniref:hypothetical protein n=1 Tax=Burkholderia paludis TaxID=1506587 RepID=UPI00126A43C1|nr:hypothetical protein [Burkholderia paludis]